MKPLSDLIHRTPWWALVLGGIAVILGLAVLVTPFHLIQYGKVGATQEENRAIKREIDNTFAEGAPVGAALAAAAGAGSGPTPTTSHHGR